MSTADNATILLAAQIGQHSPRLRPGDIARVAGKLVKTCASLRKTGVDEQTWLINKARGLADELGGTFQIIRDMPLGPYHTHDEGTHCLLHLDHRTIEVGS